MFKKKSNGWRKSLIFVIAAAMLVLSACGTSGEGSADYPKRPIEGIVPWGAGGGTDNISRAIASAVEKPLGQPVNITNKPGATATIGTQYVYDQKADGYTLLFSAENPALYGVLQLSDRSFEEFTPINILGRNIVTIVVPEQSKYQKLEDLIQDVKANPGSVKMGSTGPGGLPFVVTSMINSIAGTEFNMVPFDGDGPLVTALLGNHIDVAVVALSAAIENAKAGKVKVLAVINDEKIEALPDVPPVTEALPDMKKYLPWGPFYGVWVKKETPDEIKEKLTAAFAEAHKDENFQGLLKKMGIIPLGLTGEEADQFWRQWQSTTAWLLQDAGGAKVNPEELNIPKAK